MGKNFYFVLGVDRDAALADIQKSYRLLAVKHHPDRCNTEDSGKTFLAVAEAFDVLSDVKRRAIYDQFGEEGLRVGAPTVGEGRFSGTYTFHGDAEKVFREFFGGDNPYAEMFDFGISGNLRDAPEFGGMMGRARPQQAPDQLVKLPVSLQEVYRGCTKKLKVSRQVANDDRRTTTERNKLFNVVVPPGAEEGTKFRYKKEGDQGINMIPADLIFELESEEHPRFIRKGVDLHYRHTVMLWEALCGVWIEVRTLDDRFMTVPINDIISPGYQKVIEGEGLPYYNDRSKKGNMVIDFDVEFPKNLTPRQKEALRHTLQR